MRAERFESLRQSYRDDDAAEALRKAVCMIEGQPLALEAPLTSTPCKRALTLRQSNDSEPHSLFQASSLDQVCQAVITTDRQGQITGWNRRAEGLFQWQAAEIIGKTIDVLLVHAEGQNVVRTLLTRTRKAALWRRELFLQRKDGGQFWVEVIHTLLYGAADRPIGFVGVAVDISERKQAQANALLQAELAQANAALQAEVAERRQTEVALQQAEARYRSIFEKRDRRYFSKHTRRSLFEC